MGVSWTCGAGGACGGVRVQGVCVCVWGGSVCGGVGRVGVCVCVAGRGEVCLLRTVYVGG